MVGMWISGSGMSLPSIILTFIAIILVGWHLLYVAIPLTSLEKFFCWLTFVTGFFGPAFLFIDIGPFALFPFRIFLIILWALFTIHMLANGGKIFIKQRQIRSYLLFLVFWLWYAVISLSWAQSKTDALRHIIFLATGFSVIFFVSFYFRNEKDLKRLFWVWLGAFWSMLLIGLWEHLTGKHLPVSGYSEDKLLEVAEYVRIAVMNIPTGVFKNPNDYATFLVLSIPFNLSFIRYSQNLLLRAFGIVTFLLSSYFILITGSRANLLALFLEIGFIWVFLERGVRKLKWVVIIAMVLSISVWLLPEILELIFIKTSEQLFSLIYQAQYQIESFYVRWNLLKNGLLFV
ncbi:hypothetical protein [Thermodesulfovibrio hydrogeniphilus]